MDELKKIQELKKELILYKNYLLKLKEVENVKVRKLIKN